MNPPPNQPTRMFLDEWARTADRLGLAFHREGPRMTGTRDGVEVTASIHSWNFVVEAGVREVNTRLSKVVIRARVPAFGVRGLEIRRAGLFDALAGFFGQDDISLGDPRLDGALQVTADDHHAAALALRDPAVLSALRALADASELVIVSGTVRVTEHSWDVDERIHQAVRAAQALADVRNPVLEAAAAALGLVVDRQSIAGTVDGVALGVAPIRAGEADYEIRVPWPRGDRILPRRPSHEGGIGDPVLDELLHIAAEDRAAALQAYARDEVRGPLMELVHGRSGEVRRGELITTARHTEADLVEACRLAVDLARAVGQSC